MSISLVAVRIIWDCVRFITSGHRLSLSTKGKISVTVFHVRKVVLLSIS